MTGCQTGEQGVSEKAHRDDEEASGATARRLKSKLSEKAINLLKKD